MISRVVRKKLFVDQLRVQGMIRELRDAVESGETLGLVSRATHLEESLVSHLALVSYVLEAMSEDDVGDELESTPPDSGE